MAQKLTPRQRGYKRKPKKQKLTAKDKAIKSFNYYMKKAEVNKIFMGKPKDFNQLSLADIRAARDMLKHQIKISRIDRSAKIDANKLARSSKRMFTALNKFDDVWQGYHEWFKNHEFDIVGEVYDRYEEERDRRNKKLGRSYKATVKAYERHFTGNTIKSLNKKIEEDIARVKNEKKKLQEQRKIRRRMKDEGLKAKLAINIEEQGNALNRNLNDLNELKVRVAKTSKVVDDIKSFVMDIQDAFGHLKRGSKKVLGQLYQFTGLKQKQLGDGKSTYTIGGNEVIPSLSTEIDDDVYGRLSGYTEGIKRRKITQQGSLTLYELINKLDTEATRLEATINKLDMSQKSVESQLTFLKEAVVRKLNMILTPEKHSERMLLTKWNQHKKYMMEIGMDPLSFKEFKEELKRGTIFGGVEKKIYIRHLTEFDEQKLKQTADRYGIDSLEYISQALKMGKEFAEFE